MKTTYMTLLAVTLGLGLGEQTRAADIKQQPWRRLQEVKTESGFQSLPNSATIAMACAKCKSVTIVTKREIVTGEPARGKKEVTLVVHQCPGCGGEMARKQGTKEVTWAHTCTECGDQSVFCCATTAGTKNTTKGMESSATK
jgi:hypothetical protein